MKRIYKLNHFASYGIILGGLVFWYIKSFMQIETEYGMMNHPWQKAALSLHVLWAAFFMVVFGIMLNTHIITKLKNSQQKWFSGIILFFFLAICIISGYLLQISYGEQARESLSNIHTWSSFVFIVFYVLHHLNKRI
jgi:hypothetical protein